MANNVSYIGSAKVFELPEIRGYNEDCSSGGLHNQIHPKAIETMNQVSISHWDQPMEIFIGATYREVKKAVTQQIKSVLRGYESTELFRQVMSTFSQFLSRLKESIDWHAEQIFSLEKKQPIVRDRHIMQIHGEAFYNELKKRRKVRKVISIMQARGQALPLDRAKADKFIEQMDVEPDEFENELKMMAVRS